MYSPTRHNFVYCLLLCIIESGPQSTHFNRVQRPPRFERRDGVTCICPLNNPLSARFRDVAAGSTRARVMGNMNLCTRETILMTAIFLLLTDPVGSMILRLHFKGLRLPLPRKQNGPDKSSRPLFPANTYQHSPRALSSEFNFLRVLIQTNRLSLCFLCRVEYIIPKKRRTILIITVCPQILERMIMSH